MKSNKLYLIPLLVALFTLAFASSVKALPKKETNYISTPTMYTITKSNYYSNNYQVDWGGVSGAERYYLMTSKDSGDWTSAYYGTATFKNFSGVADGYWCYSVRAINLYPYPQEESGWSSVKCTTVLNVPDAPVLTAPSEDNNGAYTINWTDKNATYSLYEYHNGGSATYIYNGNTSNYTVSGRANGNWCYYVRAYNAAGSSGWSNTGCTTVLHPPQSPPLLTTPANDPDGNYTVSWTAVDTATSYKLMENYNGGGWLDTYTGSNLNHTISGKDNGEWCYRVLAQNASGDSSWSSLGCTTVLLPPQSPPLLTTPANDADGNYTVSWTAVDTATSYKLMESYNGGSWLDTYTGNNLNRAVSSKNGGEWCYRVLAQNTSGDSAWSTLECTDVSYRVYLPVILK